MSEAAGPAAGTADYDIGRILKALPHRYPLLLVDRVISLDIGERIHAVKAVSFNEQFFQGHFPGRPIMPGVLQIEALAGLLFNGFAAHDQAPAAGERPARETVDARADADFDAVGTDQHDRPV